MFNLHDAILEWRKQMSASGVNAPAPLDELENHLREEIERQTSSGRCEEEAFKSAVQQIGSAQALQNEFELVVKTSEGRNHLVGQFWLGAILGLLQLVVIGYVLLNPDMTFIQRTSGLAAMAVSFLFVAATRWMSRRILPVAPNRRTKSAMLVSASLALTIWNCISTRFFLQGHEFTFGQWLTTALWVCCPALGAFLGVLLGMVAASQKDVLIADQ